MIICIIETSISIENMHLVKKKNKETRPLSMVVQRSKKKILISNSKK